MPPRGYVMASYLTLLSQRRWAHVDDARVPSAWYQMQESNLP
jgi:hypothetical protein